MTCICITEHKPFVGDDFYYVESTSQKNAPTFSSTSANELSFFCFSLGEDLVVLGQLRMQSEIFLEPSSLSLSHVMNNVT